jgi:hypothetical protein
MNSLNTTNAKNLGILVAVLGLLATAAYAQPISLTNGVPVTGISGSAGSEKFYKIEVPAGQDELEISTSEGTGDVDLYVRRGAQPTTSSYDYRPYKVGNNETVTVENPAAGTWYVMLKGYNSYAGVKLLAEYSAALVITPLANGVPVPGVAGAAGAEVYFKIDVPASQTKLEISTSGGTGDADLYVRKDALPTTSSYDYRPYLIGNDESVSINNPAAATWYIMIRGYNAFGGITLLASFGGGVGTALENGVAVINLAGAPASEKIFRIDVPAGQTNLEIQISGGTGDADLYVKYGARPTTTDYDYRPFLAGSEESVTVNTPAGGTWYIMVRGYSDYAGLTLKASYGDVLLLQDGVPLKDLAGALNSVAYYRIIVPSGQDVLLLSLSGGTGNADLYLKKGSKPTTTSWDYRPIQPTNTESVSIGGGSIAGTWYVMIRGTAAYSGVTLLADYSISNTVVVLANGVAVKDIAGNQGGAKYFKLEVPAGQSKLEIAMSGGTGDADLYVRRGVLPTTAEYDFRPYLPGNDESVTVNNPAAGTWFIMIRGYQAFSGITLLATYGGGVIPDEVVELHNGVAVTGLAAASGSEKFYKILVPAGQAKLEIAVAGGTGDVDLYVRKGSQPTTSEWDYRPYLIGNNETATIDNPAAATYFILLKGYVAYAGVSLKATYTPVPEQVTALESGVAVTGLSGASGSEKFYKIDVPAAQDLLKIEIAGGSGDVDLYVRKGSKPTLTSWDYRPYLIGNNETVEVAQPAAATWYVMLRGYQAYSGLTLTATYSIAYTGNNFASDPNCVAVWRFESGKLVVDSLRTNTLSHKGVTAEATDFREGKAAADFEADESDYMSITDANLINAFPHKSNKNNDKFSVSFWVKFESLPAQRESQYLYAKSAAGKHSFSIHTYNSLGTTRLQVSHGYNNGQSSQTTYHDSPLVANVWYHVCVTYDYSTRKVHIRIWDNTAKAILGTDLVKMFSQNMSFTNAPVTIGGSMDGLIDEMVVFNDILTVAEMDKIRQATYGKQ